jgi:hypothetical protein
MEYKEAQTQEDLKIAFNQDFKAMVEHVSVVIFLSVRVGFIRVMAHVSKHVNSCM